MRAAAVRDRSTAGPTRSEGGQFPRPPDEQRIRENLRRFGVNARAFYLSAASAFPDGKGYHGTKNRLDVRKMVVEGPRPSNGQNDMGTGFYIVDRRHRQKVVEWAKGADRVIWAQLDPRARIVDPTVGEGARVFEAWKRAGGSREDFIDAFGVQIARYPWRHAGVHAYVVKDSSVILRVERDGAPIEPLGALIRHARTLPPAELPAFAARLEANALDIGELIQVGRALPRSVWPQLEQLPAEVGLWGALAAGALQKDPERLVAAARDAWTRHPGKTVEVVKSMLRPAAKLAEVGALVPELLQSAQGPTSRALIEMGPALATAAQRRAVFEVASTQTPDIASDFLDRLPVRERLAMARRLIASPKLSHDGPQRIGERAVKGLPPSPERDAVVALLRERARRSGQFIAGQLETYLGIWGVQTRAH